MSNRNGASETIHLRLPKELIERIWELALADHRSWSNMARLMLERKAEEMVAPSPRRK